MRKIIFFLILILTLLIGLPSPVLANVLTQTEAATEGTAVIGAENSPETVEVTEIVTEQAASPAISLRFGSLLPVMIITVAAVGIAAVLVLRGKNSRKADRKEDRKAHQTGETSMIPNDGIYLFGSCLGCGKRDYQEDALWHTDMKDVIPGKAVCAVICDGMGGMENGAESSARAIDSFRTRIQRIENQDDIPSKLWKIVQSTNNDVYKMNERKGLDGGTTLVSVFILDNQLYWISVGDSRIYLYRDGMLAGLNEEHELENSLYIQMLDGKLTLEDVRDTPVRELRKLTSNLGRIDIPLVDQNAKSYRLHKGDKLLLCSDGVSGTLSDYELVKCLESHDPEINCDRIAAMIEEKDKKNQDNYSAVVVYCATEEGK